MIRLHSSPLFLVVRGVLGALSLTVLVYDLARNNPQIPSLMKGVWGFTVLYSGVIGLAGYFWSGRKQIPHDSLWRRGFRSVAHCDSGCGAGPLIQDGEPLHSALKDALYGETASITVMEVTALGVDRLVGGNAGMGDILFWSALVFSLTLGLAAAYPVNVLLVHTGVKEGMSDPTAPR